MQPRLELADLTGKLRLVGGLTESVVRRTLQMMTNRTERLVDGITADAAEIARTVGEIGDLAARRRALAADARDVERLEAARRVCAELERLSDAVAYMALRSPSMLTDSPWATLADFSRLESLMPAMVEQALEAFRSQDVEQAKRVLESCSEVMTLCAALDAAMHDAVQSDCDLARAAGDSVLVTHTLERMSSNLFAIAALTLTLPPERARGSRADYRIRATFSDGRHAA